MCFTQPVKIYENDSRIVQTKGRQDRPPWRITWSITCQDEVGKRQVLLNHVSRTICESGSHKCGRGPRKEWEDIAVKICHSTLDKLCTLTGVFSRTDGGRRATIPGNYW